MNTRVISITPLNLAELLHPSIGATVVSAKYPIDQMVGKMTELLPSMKTPQQSSLISNYTFQCLPLTASIWTEFADDLAFDLNAQVRRALRIESPIQFDDLYLTHYKEPEEGNALGVGPHRDTNCKGIVAAFILKGVLPSAICKEKDMCDPVLQEVSAGELLLMRAAHCWNLEKPLHFVGEIGRRSVIQFGMRQYIEKH